MTPIFDETYVKVDTVYTHVKAYGHRMLALGFALGTLGASAMWCWLTW